MKREILQVSPRPHSVSDYTQVERELVCICVKILTASWRNKETREYMLECSV